MNESAHIIHEAPSQRRTHRLNAPIAVFIDGIKYNTVDWSLLDFKVADYQGVLQKGIRTSVVIQIPYQGFNVSFQTEATVVHHNTTLKTLACEFFDLDERGKEILESFVAGLVRGEMETINGVIRRMDVPVTPASLKPDVPLSEAELKAQDRKRIVGSMIYLSAGALFLCALLVILYTNLFQLKIETAVLTAPTDIVIAPATGEIAHIQVKEREAIKLGQDMISFTDPELEQNIERATLKVKEASATTGEQPEISPELASVQESIGALQRSLNVRAAALGRLRGMMGEGLAIRTDYDRAQGEYFQAKAELSKAMERLNSLKSNGTGTASLLSIAQGELALLKEQRKRLSIKAPADGSIVHVMQREGTSVRYGDPVAIFEHSQPRYIEANLTREEALSVAVGDEATVYFPSHNQEVTFRVSDVDYASKLVSRREGMYVMEQAGLSRDVVARLVLKDQDKAKLIDMVTPGTSAVVVFNKIKWGNNDLPPEQKQAALDAQLPTNTDTSVPTAPAAVDGVTKEDNAKKPSPALAAPQASTPEVKAADTPTNSTTNNAVPTDKPSEDKQ
jgi:multidrug resistance efflux pump